MQTSVQQRHSHRDGGFTLVEVLVVMVIFSILVALGLSVLGTSGTQARIASTQATLKHLDAIIGQRTEAFRAADLTRIVQNFETAYETANMTTLTAQDRKAAEILVRKNLFRQLFPMQPKDLWGMDGDESTTEDNAPQSTQIDSSWTGPELFYWSMTQGTSYGLSPVTLDGIPASSIVKSPAHSDRLIFVDAWGQPIQFFRWPTALMASANLPSARVLIPGLPRTTNKDPDDPLKILQKNVKFSNFSAAMMPVVTFNLRIGMATISAKAFNHDDYHDEEAFHSPLLVSGGPDRTTGLTDPQTEAHAVVNDAAAIADNITNRQGK